jgi:hypothetical protein
MDWDVTDVMLVDQAALWVRFRDGVEGPVRFLPTFFRGVFAHLRDPEQFRKVSVVDGVVTWPGDLDLAPDAMHDRIKTGGEWIFA